MMSVENAARRVSRGGGLVVRPQPIRFLAIQQTIFASFLDESMLRSVNDIDLVVLQRHVIRGECGKLSTRIVPQASKIV